MIRLKNRVTASTEGIHSGSNTTNNYHGMEESDGPSQSAGVNEASGTSWAMQTKILFLKTWKCKFRAGKNKLLEEILTPVLFLLALAVFSWTLRKTRETYPSETQEFNAHDILDSQFFSYQIHVVHGNETYAKEIMADMNSVWKSQQRRELNFTWISNEQDLKIEYNRDPESIVLAVILPETPNTLSYSIRTNPDYYNTKLLPSPSTDVVGLETCRVHLHPEILDDPSNCPVNGYFYSSFLSLQYLVDQALIMNQMKGKSARNIEHPKITMQNYPKPSYNPGLPITLRILIPLYLTMSFLPFVGNLMVLIVTEKENKIKDGLRMIGVSEVAYWVSCFAAYAVIMILVSLLCTIVIAWIIIQDTDRILIFLLTLLFGLSLITFAFAMTPFFHKPKTAASAAAYVLTLSTLLFLLQTFFKDSSKGLLVPLRLISTVAFTTAIDEACAYEFFGGIEWKDLTPNGKGSGILLSLLFLIFDIVLYGMIAIYLDNIIPNEYGVKKHPLFCFARSYWQECCTQQTVQSQTYDNVLSGSVVDNEDVENIDNSLRRRNAIRIRNISKTFGSWSRKETVHALTEISMDIYEGQITAVLGRNGAGKSTLINILTGFLTPTSGQCVLFGLDLANPHDMARLRRMSGVCMQQDLHFEKLTVQEHLEFYGKLRGVESTKLLVEMEGLLHELQLTEQKNVASEKLSGGQRRKLSVGIALIGSPKFILLDEPSAGVDPVSRRHIWSLLQSKKEGRVILLTTHFMDEADILADRKAIVHEGTLKCMGSSLFLKTKFGIGYYLTVELDERNPDVKRSNEIVAAFIPEAVASAQVVGNEVKYGLSHSKVDKFPAMFRTFETEIDSSSAIASFGVSLTTLEEVFLKISSEDETTSAAASTMPHRRRDSVNSIQSGFDGLPSGNPSELVQVTEEDQFSNLIPNAGKISPSSAQILMAMCGLRLKRLTRNYMSFIILIIMPVVSLTAGFLVLKYSGGDVVEQVTFSVATQSNVNVYPESSLNFALSRESTDNFTAFMQGLKGVKTYLYSGVYQDLLKLGDPDKGTLASVSTKPGNIFQMRINGTFLHAPALVMNLFSQFYLKELMLEEGVTAAVPLSTEYHPFPSKSSQNLQIAKSLNSLLLLGTVFIYVSGALIMEIVKDREIKARTHLRVNGVSFNLYFLPMLSLFCGLAVCHVFMQVVIVYAFSVDAFTNIYAAVTMVVLLLICIFPSLLFTAAFSYLFNKMDTAQRVFFNFSIIAGYFCMLLRLGLETKYPDQSLLMVIVMCSLNVFYTPYAIFNLVFKEFVVCTYLGTCDQRSFKNYWGTETQAIFIIMLLQIPLFYVLLLLADFLKNGGRIRDLPVLKSFLNRRSPRNLISHGMGEVEEDDDVTDEKSRVSRFLSSSQEATAVVAIQDLRKNYQVKTPRLDVMGNKTKLKEVLRGISFLVEEGEVFGLLGHNGAGKTTCIKMMIAEEFPDDGNVWLCGHAVKSNYSPAFMQLGYCPQHDALWDNITLQEHIELYMTIRGVDKNNRSRLVEHFLKGLQIEEHAKKQSKKLSGGTKRKLSYCMSVLGSPKIVLLDEPSTGMDVTSKRFLWNTIIATFKDKRGAILTTHAMEEADALCTRIAIMVRGALVCIGSPQHLKSKYGVGYTLEVKIRAGSPVSSLHSLPNVNDGDEMPADPNKFSFIKDRFPSAVLSEQFGDRAIYSIPKLDLKISDAFEILESLKQSSNIEEYSFSQTTLEQVFIQFSKENEETQY